VQIPLTLGTIRLSKKQLIIATFYINMYTFLKSNYLYKRFVCFNVSVTDVYFVVLIPGILFIGAAFVGFILDLVDEMRNTLNK
jgi:hypothetical protein